ncbi:MAG TPA: hypothetical protein VJB05_00135 [archaeon]|nr:hypothetical protein [archaeon]
MKKDDVEKRLEIMVRELHSMLTEVRTGKRKISLNELKKKVSSRAKDHNTTEFIRKMREREY